VRAIDCAGKQSPCAAALSEELVDDFEDGDARPVHPRFEAWPVYADAASTISPAPFATAAHGANGSGRAIHVSGTVADKGYLSVAAMAAGGSTDLSAYAGIAFSARGVGLVRDNVGTTDIDVAGNYDDCGRSIFLTPTWRRYVIRFDDPDFAQGNWGIRTAFAPSKVGRLVFANVQYGPLDFWVDDVVLLEPAAKPWLPSRSWKKGPLGAASGVSSAHRG